MKDQHTRPPYIPACSYNKGTEVVSSLWLFQRVADHPKGVIYWAWIKKKKIYDKIKEKGWLNGWKEGRREGRRERRKTFLDFQKSIYIFNACLFSYIRDTEDLLLPSQTQMLAELLAFHLCSITNKYLPTDWEESGVHSTRELMN